MTWWHVIVLAIVQGMAELLPVSSSAHVIIAEKLMGMNPAAPEMTLLLVMLHTGTMVAVIVYFWRRWARTFFSSMTEFKNFAVALIVATILTGIVGGGIIEFIEKVLMRHQPHAWVEQLFNRLDLIAIALAAAGVLILFAGLVENRREKLDHAINPAQNGGSNGGRNVTGPPPEAPAARTAVGAGVLERNSIAPASEMSAKQYSWIGAIQGLVIPFRGFSRSGSTISVGLLLRVARRTAEDFSFALAVVLTPPADAREIWRLYQAQHHQLAAVVPAATTSLLGMVFAFVAGLLALKWLSRWLESGKWYIFGIYCLVAACVVAFLYHAGF
ncbi:MAG TPA: undecaprenyl-diphosphate phosphatase [Candidatus Acidoferrales bacterium]|nr:undecaprenyl-diphosphate phosphatase [Candidatus Acidoferrales bacterium]